MSNLFSILCSDGTRYDIGTGRPDYPLSIDLKITEICNHQCPWCYENSTNKGNHGNVDNILEALKELPVGTEVAIGGGNPLTHPELNRLVRILSNRGLICNMTIRDFDVTPDLVIPKGIKALGVSMTPGINPKSYIDKLKEINSYFVCHLILGVNSLDDYIKAKQYFPRLLWLGFKNIGRGKSWPKDSIDEIRKSIIKDLYLGINNIVSFDNKAVSQLNLQSAFLKSEWDRNYLGDDFTKSMFVDGVRETYSKSSLSQENERVSWKECSLVNYFRNDKILRSEK